MKSALALPVLCFIAYIVMLTTRERARARLAGAGLASLEQFNDRVGGLIRTAALHHSNNDEAWRPILHFGDLLRIWRNSRKLEQEASYLGDILCTWKDVSEKLYLEEIQTGLGNVSSGLTCNLFISALEITFGKIRPHGHYFYTLAVAGTYCEMAYMIESMENILERETAAEALRRHLR